MADIQELETIRLKYKQKIIQRIIILLIGMVIIDVIIYLSFKEIVFGYLMLFGFIMADLILLLITLGFFINPINEEYKKIAKEKIIAKQLSEIFSNVKYNAEGLAETNFKKAYLYNQYTTYKSSDLIEATYQGKAFSSADVHIERVVSTGKTTHVEVIFQGLFLIFDIDRKINNCTQVYPKGKRGYTKEFFGNSKELDKVKFESEVFNRAFNVYCEDGSEAFYLLTPKIMEILLNLQRKLDFSCSFVDNKMYIAIANKNDYFEISVFQPINQALYNEQLRSSREISEIVTAINEIQWN